MICGKCLLNIALWKMVLMNIQFSNSRGYMIRKPYKSWTTKRSVLKIWDESFFFCQEWHKQMNDIFKSIPLHSSHLFQGVFHLSKFIEIPFLYGAKRQCHISFNVFHVFNYLPPPQISGSSPCWGWRHCCNIWENAKIFRKLGTLNIEL